MHSIRIRQSCIQQILLNVRELDPIDWKNGNYNPPKLDQYIDFWGIMLFVKEIVQHQDFVEIA